MALFGLIDEDVQYLQPGQLHNPKKSTGQRNRWLTWILRAPSVGIKLLWQTILTYQLSFYSSEALSSGSKASFVHARPLPGVKELAKRNSQYEESSFVTIAEGSRFATPSTLTPIRLLTTEEFGSIQPRVSKFILPISKRTDLLKEISARKSKERSNFSLNEKGASLNDAENGDQYEFPRSKSFGNEFGDSIPFIDSSDENGTAMEANATCGQEDPLSNSKAENEGYSGENGCIDSQSVPCSPEKSDKYVQTDESAESPTKRSPKKRFPRLGTFERIKIDKKNVSEPSTPSQASPSHTRTGTSFRHRRPIKSTISKEQLLKSTAISPSKDDRDLTDPIPQPPVVQKKKSKGIFSRFWKRESKVLEPEKLDLKKNLESKNLVLEPENNEVHEELNLDNAPTPECPPDYESAVRSTGPTWLLCRTLDDVLSATESPSVVTTREDMEDTPVRSRGALLDTV